MAQPLKLTALHYEYVEQILELREPHRGEHLALVAAGIEAESLVVAGALGDPPRGAFFAFRDSAAAERFAAADPYGAAGLVTSTRVEPWTVVAHGRLEAELLP